MDIAHALDLAHHASDQVRGTTSPNPPVGAVILDADGEVVGVGATAPPGGPHAEVVALAAAGARANGGTAVVTLEPCNHYGRTGPCSKALLEAGIAHVFYANADPFPSAAGGGAFLAEAGVDTHFLDERIRVLEPWLQATRLGRPHVTLKFASTVDGFAGATDGTSQWITGPDARAFVHEDRSKRDAIIVGTGTALTDNPSLTARTDTGLYENQPRRVVIGSREVPADSNLARLGYEQYAGIPEALSALWDKGCRDILIEGGPTLAGAALRLGIVDQVQAYVAPALLGAGRSVINWPQETTMDQIMRFDTTSVRQLGSDVLIEMMRKER
ncbi:bifunctional diaminohydroxyphosphoribosylaminopyrimidine deaminase/5-amino-6-(5-phosphoribosylamino)uracil reductase RibD [Corynebacterium glutamicum]|uniref:bifunctional diaminohydroxyphosphoribosylaminopyrimidine deaminase/5-amino-6-(5-phosphoribosylamino)uracil reductase RibD n=1 Tax=Corynebacterium glutamicum TaxID=1718 RepID=UPI000744D06F|nr:bifunctional diaminohydroxyphosphoribosylaminopyrimidine deaminase/5-amino-6-(5-phosphoribosylamino)uracil reductase RibD [Corynebacterium glutamicum]AMA00290.1 bifunctional diaminohydroxyphosphoribosylaminopyrimidine deaminase/5-amino-6-(5-phosphoribosylamino)uracil reductase [Corynebacterium glutamicum]